MSDMQVTCHGQCYINAQTQPFSLTLRVLMEVYKFVLQI